MERWSEPPWWTGSSISFPVITQFDGRFIVSVPSGLWCTDEVTVFIHASSIRHTWSPASAKSLWWMTMQPHQSSNYYFSLNMRLNGIEASDLVCLAGQPKAMTSSCLFTSQRLHEIFLRPQLAFNLNLFKTKWETVLRAGLAAPSSCIFHHFYKEDKLRDLSRPLLTTASY